MTKTNLLSKAALLCLMLGVITACTKSETADTSTSTVKVQPIAIVDGVSFKADLVPVLRRRCATCHLTGEEAGNMTLHPKAAYNNLLGVDGMGRTSTGSNHLIVKPNAPDQSYLIIKLENTQLEHGGTGAQMPFAAPPLDPQTIQNFRDWIASGAPNN